MEIDHIDRLKELVFSIREDEDNIYHIFAEDKGICYYIKEGKGWISRREIGYMKTTTLSESTTIWTPKPEPVKVPLTDIDIWERTKHNKTMWVQHNGLYDKRLITEVCKGGVYLATEEDETTYENLMKNYTFADGDPCHKVEERSE